MPGIRSIGHDEEHGDTLGMRHPAAQGRTARIGAIAWRRLQRDAAAACADLIPWLEEENWWGENRHGEQLDVPHLMIAAIKPSWQVNAQKLTVEEKKEVFYRFMLPLVLHANEMVMNRRDGLLRAQRELDSGPVSADSLALLRRLVLLLPGFDDARATALAADDPELPGMIDDLLRRVDVIPPGLALGQAAYESGYGTSRFAVEGNSLFGQWTYGGDGIKPKEQRRSKGDHRIKAFDWPFDSVRGYFINLMSHPAYEEFRRLRAEARAAGRPLTSMELADGLIRYSERGQEYVDTLKGIIRVNGLDIADNAVFRDEPMRFSIGAADETAAAALRSDIEAMRLDLFRRAPVLVPARHLVNGLFMLAAVVVGLYMAFTVYGTDAVMWSAIALVAISLVLGVLLVIAGIILSTLHQSSLGTLFLATPFRLHPLWHSTALPIFFFVSAIPVALSMVIFEGSISHKVFRSHISPEDHAGHNGILLGLSLYYAGDLIEATDRLSTAAERAVGEQREEALWYAVVAAGEAVDRGAAAFHASNHRAWKASASVASGSTVVTSLPADHPQHTSRHETADEHHRAGDESTSVGGGHPASRSATRSITPR